MKRVITIISVLMLMLVSLCSCGNDVSTETQDNLKQDITVPVYSNDDVDINITYYDDSTGYMTWEITNQSSTPITVLVNTCTDNEKHSCDLPIFTDTIAPGATAQETDIQICDDNWDYYAFSGGWSFDVSATYYNEDDYEDHNIEFELTPKMFGFDE